MRCEFLFLFTTFCTGMLIHKAENSKTYTLMPAHALLGRQAGPFTSFPLYFRAVKRFMCVIYNITSRTAYTFFARETLQESIHFFTFIIFVSISFHLPHLTQIPTEYPFFMDYKPTSLLPRWGQVCWTANHFPC